MEITKNVRKILLIYGIVFVLVLIGIVIVGRIYRKQPQRQTVMQVNNQRKQIPLSQVPDKFPANIPIEKGATITKNYNTTGTGLFQATRGFETNASLADNLAIYTKYLTDNGWKIDANVNQPTLVMVMGSKGSQTLQVTGNENSVTNVKTITISLTEDN